MSAGKPAFEDRVERDHRGRFDRVGHERGEREREREPWEWERRHGRHERFEHHHGRR